MEHGLDGVAENSVAAAAEMMMKRSPSELAFEEFFSIEPPHPQDHDRPFFDRLSSAPKTNREQEEEMGKTNNGTVAAHEYPNSTTIDTESHSSFICAGNWSTSGDHTITNTQKSRARRILLVASRSRSRSSTGSSAGDQSDGDVEAEYEEEELEIEAGPSEQSNVLNDPVHLKRIRRKVSNRESARRSRKRKQAHMAELELQVERLRGENAGLLKQFTDASQIYKDANTNYRVLKSDVEALRAKVRLGEGILSAGSVTSCGVNKNNYQLLHPQDLSPALLASVVNNINVSPTITVPLSSSSSSLGGGVLLNESDHLATAVSVSSCVSSDHHIWP